MKDLASKSEGISIIAEKKGTGLHDSSRPESMAGLKSLLKKVRASFDNPFESGRDKETALNWLWRVKRNDRNERWFRDGRGWQTGNRRSRT